MKKYSLINTLIVLSKWISIHNKRNILKLLLASISVGLLEVISLMSIEPILTIFNDQKNINGALFGLNSNNLILVLAFSYSLMLCFIAFLKIKTISYGNFLSAYIGEEIGNNLLKNFLGQEFLKHLNRDSAIVINTFALHLTRTVRFISLFLQILVASFITICILIFIVFDNPITVTGTFFSVGLGYLYTAKKYKLKTISYASIVKTRLDEITKLMQEVTSDIEKNILEYRDNEIIKKFSISYKDSRISDAKMRNYQVIPKYIIEVAAISSFLLLTLISSLFFKEDNITLIAKLSASLFGLQKLLPSINQIYSSWTLMNSNLPNVYSVKDLFSEYSDESRINKNNKKIKYFNNSIVLSKINFGYEKGNQIFNNFNLKIQKGEKILIKAKSGFGKSTLIKIICCLLKPLQGQILIDDKCLNSKNSVINWQRQIGLVKQKPYLKRGKIIDLILGREIKGTFNKDLKEAKYFADLVCISEYVESLPNGYMQNIDEDGNSLSGGQIQRIAIASALALKPSLLILDESTSGIDTITESKIFKNIMKIENLTAIVISHSSNVEKIFSKKIIL